MHLFHSMREPVYFICIKTIELSLVFIVAIVPLIINPKAFDYWYRPKIESVYALLIIAGVAWLLKALVKDRSFLWEGSPLTIPLLCYASATTLSTIFSINARLSLYGDPLRVEGLYTILTYISLVFVFINLVRNQELVRKLFKGLFIGATLVSLYALIQYFGYNPTEHFYFKYITKGRIAVGSTIGNPNFLGKYLVLIIPIMFCFCLGSISIKRSVVLVSALSLCLAALIVTYTRASWLSTIIGLVILLFLSFKNSLHKGEKKRLIIIGVILFLLILFFNAYSPRHSKKRVTSNNQKATGEVVKRTLSTFDIKKGMGVATRLYVWEKTLILIKERPWFGYGLETFEIAFKDYNIEYVKIFNNLVYVDRAHNNYIDTAFSIGLIGLGTYLAVIVTFLYHLFSLLKKSDDKFHKLLYAGIISSFCGYLINDIFIFSVVSVSPTFWSLMGLTVAMGKVNDQVPFHSG